MVLLAPVLCLLAATQARAAGPAAGPALMVGDPAPPFAVERWLAGPPVERLERGHVYVIEFWATWCGPCIAGMPHLSALQRELGAQGLSVIGVAPRPDEWGHDLGSIAALLAAKKDELAYSLALDDEGSKDGYQGVFHGRTIEGWMGAAQVGAIPIAFVVDREGRLAAIAPPLEIDAVVRACLDGTFARERAAAEYRALLAARAQLEELKTLLAKGDHELALALAEELLAGPLANDARYLGSLADMLLEARTAASLALARRAAERAVELTEMSDSGALFELARADFAAGERSAGRAHAAAALAHAEGAYRGALERDLARFEREAVAPDSDAAALEAVLACFARTPLVGLGEHHRRREVHDFLLALVDHPRFGQLVDDIVVEFGNAREQALVDRYIGGEDVPPGELARVWRDTTQWLVWDSPLYEQFFARVRARNLARPADERVRVLLGDPPISWAEVHGAADYRAFAERDAHFAAVVEREVLGKNRRALLVTGITHLERRGPLDAAMPGGPSAAALLGAHHPDALSVVWTLPADAALAKRLGFERAPAVRVVAGDPLAKESFALLAPAGIQIRIGNEWKPMGALRWPPLGEMVDVLLFVGAADTQVDPDPALYRDAPYQTELRRRAAILSAVYGMDFLPELEGLLTPSGR